MLRSMGLLRHLPLIYQLKSRSLPLKAMFHLQRGRSTSNSAAEIIKIKRSETSDDIFSAITKDIGVNKGGNDDENEIFEDDVHEDDLQSNDDDDPRNGNKHRHKQRVSHGYHLVERKMKHGLEDYLVTRSGKLDDHELWQYAIFDCHSGHKVAEYLQSHLFKNILNEVLISGKAKKKQLKRAYEATDNDILENVVGPRGCSTVVTAMLIDTDKLIVANVGDLGPVSCRNGAAKPISLDHEPMKEKKVNESKGGFVSNKPGNIPRVDSQLAMTRAFGDERLKGHITAEPDTFIEEIDEDMEFIILASDGLWKVMSNQDAVDCIRGLKDGKEAAEELIKEALVRDSKDDISCVVVMFHG